MFVFWGQFKYAVGVVIIWHFLWGGVWTEAAPGEKEKAWGGAWERTEREIEFAKSLCHNLSSWIQLYLKPVDLYT